MISTVVEHFKSKYRMGRWLLWIGVVFLFGVALSGALTWIIHPAKWVLVVSCFALGWVMPTPRWTLKSPPSRYEEIERRLRHAVDVIVGDRLSPEYAEARLRQLLRDAAAADPRWTEEAETVAKKAAIHLTASYAAGASDVVPSDENIALAVLAALADAGLLTSPQTPDAAQNRGWNSPRPA